MGKCALKQHVTGFMQLVGFLCMFVCGDYDVREVISEHDAVVGI